MKRIHATHLLRIFVAAFVALASIGPPVTYAHSHAVEADGHHDHGSHDATADHHHDDHNDNGPELDHAVAHVHGWWLGFLVTLPSVAGPSVSDDGVTPAACLTVSGNAAKGLFGPLKERVPWPAFFVPPDPASPLAGHFSEASFLGTRASHALAGCTLVLRC